MNILLILAALFVIPNTGTAKKALNLYEYQAKLTILNNQHYFESLIREIRQAKSSIYVSMYLFKITKNPKNPAVTVMNELINARKRGIIVKLLLEKSGYSKSLNSYNTHIAKKLRRQKVSVCFDTPGTQTHTKAIIIDSQLSYIGSHNLSASALQWNNEISVLIKSKPIAKKLLQYIKKIKGNRCY